MLRDVIRATVSLIKRNRSMVIMSVALVIFLAVLMRLRGDKIAYLDNMAYSFFVLRLRRPWLTPIMESISNLAMPVVLAVMLLVVEAFAPGRRPGLCAGINLVLAVGINLLLKEIVQRPRPDETIRLVTESGYSFPSGHSMVSMAFYGLLLWMVWRYEKDRVVKWTCITGFACVIALVGMSRIYLGVHYASDVIAGFCVSVVWLGIYTKVAVPLLIGDEIHEPGEIDVPIITRGESAVACFIPKCSSASMALSSSNQAPSPILRFRKPFTTLNFSTAGQLAVRYSPIS